MIIEKMESLLGFFLVTLFILIYIIIPLVMIFAIVRCRPCVRVGVFLIAIVVTNIQSISAGRKIGETDKYKEVLKKTSSPYDKLFKHLEDLVTKGEYCTLSNDLVRLRKEGFVIFTPVFPVQKTFEETVDEILCRDNVAEPFSSVDVNKSGTNGLKYCTATNGLTLMEAIIEARCLFFVVNMRMEELLPTGSLLKFSRLDTETLNRDMKEFFDLLKDEPLQMEGQLSAQLNHEIEKTENIIAGRTRKREVWIANLSDDQRLELLSCLAHYKAIMFEAAEAGFRKQLAERLNKPSESQAIEDSPKQEPTR